MEEPQPHTVRIGTYWVNEPWNCRPRITLTKCRRSNRGVLSVLRSALERCQRASDSTTDNPRPDFPAHRV